MGNSENMGNSEISIIYHPDFGVALENNGYALCEQIYGSSFTYWYTHAYSFRRK